MYVFRVPRIRLMNVKYIYVVAFFALAAAAFGSENVVLNAGFEAGGLAPWTANNMSASREGAYSGDYGAYFFVRLEGDGCAGGAQADAEQVVWGDIKQDFGREITPAELRGVDFRVYYAPDVEGNPWRLDVALGPNEYILSSSRGELKKGWNHIWIPVERVTRPFSFAHIKSSLTTG